MKRKAERMETSAKELISKVGKLPDPPNMPERDVRREISVEFQERDKECEKIKNDSYEILDNLVTVNEELRYLDAETRLNNCIEQMKEVVQESKVLVRSLDKSLGLCTEYPNPSRSLVPTPEISQFFIN